MHMAFFKVAKLDGLFFNQSIFMFLFINLYFLFGY